MTGARRVVVGITGATGGIYGIRLLELLRGFPEVESHLVISGPGKRTIVAETESTVAEVEALAHRHYDDKDIGAALASGSFRTDGMVIALCSIKTASAVAHCHTDTLLSRAADVTLKERRPLILLVRETPLHAFYSRPKQIEDLVTHTLARALDHLRLPHRLTEEWKGTQPRPPRFDPPGA